MMLGIGCTQSTAPTTNIGNPKPILDPSNNAGGHKAGTHCFHFEDATSTVDGQLELAADNQVSGFLKGMVKDEEEGKDVIWDNSFHGKMEGDSLRLDVLSNETGTKQSTKETWAWKADGLITETRLLAPAACK